MGRRGDWGISGQGSAASRHCTGQRRLQRHQLYYGLHRARVGRHARPRYAVPEKAQLQPQKLALAALPSRTPAEYVPHLNHITQVLRRCRRKDQPIAQIHHLAPTQRTRLSHATVDSAAPWSSSLLAVRLYAALRAFGSSAPSTGPQDSAPRSQSDARFGSPVPPRRISTPPANRMSRGGTARRGPPCQRPWRSRAILLRAAEKWRA